MPYRILQEALIPSFILPSVLTSQFSTIFSRAMAEWWFWTLSAILITPRTPLWWDGPLPAFRSPTTLLKLFLESINGKKMDCIMKKIKRAYILLFVCVMTVCFSGCQNQSDVSSEDVENSLFMEWCSRFRASNEPLILITFPDGTSTALVGENAVTAASDMELSLIHISEPTRPY